MKSCDLCGKPAIGIQFYGCCSTAVCREHAESRLLELEPGAKREWGVCYYWRFRQPGIEE
jgi:hypothetical protein